MSIYSAEAIVEEGFRRAGRCLSPTERQRGVTNILQEIRHDIWTRTTMSGTTQLRALACDSLMILRPGQTRYSLPDDFDQLEGCYLYDGTRTLSVLTSVSQNVIQLDGGADISTNDLGRKIIWINGGAEAYLQEIVGISLSTNWSLTLAADFENDLVPAPGTQFLVVDRVDELSEVYMEELEAGVTYSTGRPFEFAIQSERLQLDRPPDKDYPVRIRYYVNVAKVETGSKIDTQINERWYSVLVKGVYWVASLQIGQIEARDAYAQYLEAVEHLKWKEQDRGADESSLGFWPTEQR